YDPLGGDPADLQFNQAGEPNNPVSASLQAVGLMPIPRPNFLDLIEYLENHGYQRGQDLFIFPYDFRYSVDYNAAKLRNKINEVAHTNSKVDLVCHSMGGLLAKSALTDPLVADKVE